MNILTFTGTALIMCILIMTVRQLKPEMSLLLAIACGAALTVFLLHYFLLFIPIMKPDKTYIHAKATTKKYNLFT